MENVFYGKIVSEISSGATSRFSRLTNLYLKRGNLEDRVEELLKKITNAYTTIKHHSPSDKSFSVYLNELEDIQKGINSDLKELSKYDVDGYFSEFIKDYSEETFKDKYSSKMATLDEYNDILNKNFDYRDLASMNVVDRIERKDIISAYNNARRDKEKTLELISKRMVSKINYRLSNIASFLEENDVYKYYPNLEEKLYNACFNYIKETQSVNDSIREAISEIQ